MRQLEALHRQNFACCRGAPLLGYGNSRSDSFRSHLAIRIIGSYGANEPAAGRIRASFTSFLMPTFAAVDIGSNSVRLKIAKVSHGRLHTLHEDREVTRLGEGVFANGALDPEAMALTIRVLSRFHRAVQDHAADRVRVVATAALRDSRNSRAFLDWVRSATGWHAP